MKSDKVRMTHFRCATLTRAIVAPEMTPQPHNALNFKPLNSTLANFGEVGLRVFLTPFEVPDEYRRGT